MATGFNFRATAGYVTDGGGETYCLGEPEAYPTTRSGSTFGWSGLVSGDAEVNRNAGNDRRLAGINYKANDGTQATFRLDLPAPGTYRIRLALGDTVLQGDQYVQIRDGGSAVLTINDTTGTAAGTWDDATGTAYNNANWPGSNTSVNVAFTGTILNMVIGTPTAQSDSSTIAHLFVEPSGISLAVGFGELNATGYAPTIVTVGTASAALGGTIVSATTETDIVTGGKTIIITLSGTTWVP